MIAGTVSVPLRDPAAGPRGPGRVVVERQWSDRRIRWAARRDAVRSAGVSTDPVRASPVAVPQLGCRSADGTRSGRAASRRRAGVQVRADPGRDAAEARSAGSGQQGAADDRVAVEAAPRAVRPPDRAALPASSRWAAVPARARWDVAGERAAGWAVRPTDPRGSAVRAEGVARQVVVGPVPGVAERAPGAGRPVPRGGARRLRDAGLSVRCPPGRPDPEPSAARGWRAVPAAVADGTPSGRPFRGTLPWDIAPTVRDLRAVVIARADRHPLMNLAFPQLTADTAVLERLRGIPQ